jgi:hypothetical protein
MDGDFALFLITMGVMIVIFGIAFLVGKNYTKKRKNNPAN